MPTNFIVLTRGLALQLNFYFFLIINNYHLKKEDNTIELVAITLLFSNRPTLFKNACGLCFSVERRVIFPLRNVKCKDYVSCQFVEATHTKNKVTFIVDKKKNNKKKRLLSFLHMFSKVQHLKGLMTFGDN